MGGLSLALVVIDVLAVAGRWVADPSLTGKDLPIATAAVTSLVAVFLLNRTAFHRVAAFLLCFNFVWLNLIEGLQRPEGPVWYALVPLSAILGAALLRFRAALVLAGLGLLSVLVVVVVRADAMAADRGTLIAMYVFLANAAALGMAAFREGVERERQAEFAQISAQLASNERLESIGRLAGGVAHDFNNLLTVMLASADAMRDGQADAIDDLVSAGERAAALTRQLLAFSRHQGGDRVVVAVDEAIAEVRPLLRRLLPENIELVILLGSAASVRLGGQQLEQLVFNLAANARDAMPGGGRFIIETSVKHVGPGAAGGPAPGDYVVIRVTDDGVGMDQKTRVRVFEPFFTTKAPGQGTGLGLANVHGIVTQAGGFIELDSAVGSGTQICLGLPRIPATGTVEPEPAAVVTERFAGRVLLVEDEPLVMRSTARLLEEFGLTVIQASRPDAVPDALDKNPGSLALLVTDVVMPGRSGPQLVGELRSHDPGLPVLLLSGYAPVDLQPLLETPRTRFLAKPYSKAALGHAVQQLLRDPAVEATAAPRTVAGRV